MIKVLFFGRTREELGTGSVELEWGDAVSDLDTLQQTLIDANGDNWSRVLGQDNMIRAVNQEVAEAGRALADGDEVAFFPPVTGG